MLDLRESRFVHTYSEIKGLQEKSTLTYLVSVTGEGTMITVRQQSDSGVNTEACVCPDFSFEDACLTITYACENSVGMGCWLNLFDDLNIEYKVI